MNNWALYVFTTKPEAIAQLPEDFNGVIIFGIVATYHRSKSRLSLFLGLLPHPHLLSHLPNFIRLTESPYRRHTTHFWHPI